MKFEPGSLIACRGREWVVLPDSDDQSLLIKPIGGLDLEIIRVFPQLESVAPAAFPPPDPERGGDARSSALLRDAARLGLRSATGPFRSFANLAFAPMPYQLAPLLLALKQETTRLLIADDVGVGKTVEALLIARELLDRGEIGRVAVICPPQLVEQWQKEMAEKFNLNAALVLPSTVARLERGLPPSVSLFQKHPFTIVSLDYVKSDSRRAEFVRACPEMVIVDEAHACAAGGRGGKRRYELVAALAANPRRHMLFTTATPHSGKEYSFRSLLTFLNPDFADLPEDLDADERARRRLAEYFIQRRRGDVLAFSRADKPFPKRETRELNWKADAKWLDLFNKCLDLARENVGADKDESRVGWWSALALLRAVSSSPAAARETLTNRAFGADLELSRERLDELGRRALYDLDSEEGELIDSPPGADAEETGRPKNRCRALAAVADKLRGKNDPKLKALIPHLKSLLKDGFSPIIFCRFIPTAEYLADELRPELKNVAIASVTGLLPPDEREERVKALGEAGQRVLVCTDCLSEGINLQETFNAVIHYDLSWNPTRHEQREGRADRFNQPSETVRVITWYGADNPMDGMVLDVLLRKREAIRKSLGVSLPAPMDSEQILETLIKGLILRKGSRGPAARSALLPGLEDYGERERLRAEAEWEKARARAEKRSNTMFAQTRIKTEEAARLLAEADAAMGDPGAVERFVIGAWRLLGGEPRKIRRDGRDAYVCGFGPDVRAKFPALELPPDGAEFVFAPPANNSQTLLTRTHPLVENLAAWLIENSLDSRADPLLARCGVMRTKAVDRRHTLLLCRLRFTLTSGERESAAEECSVIAFAGSPRNAEWLDDASRLLEAEPAENASPAQAAEFLGKVRDGLDYLAPALADWHQKRADALLAAHRRVRDEAKLKNVRYKVEPQGKPDILGVYVYLPALGEKP